MFNSLEIQADIFQGFSSFIKEATNSTGDKVPNWNVYAI
jgi:hypothetical protein